MYEEKQMFGRCPVCDAITSLDPEKNQLCDRCYSERFIPYYKRWKDICDSRREDNQKGITGTSDPILQNNDADSLMIMQRRFDKYGIREL